MKNVRVTQLDGALPNVALMRIAAYHKANGDRVFFERQARLHHDEPKYDLVYGSSIFKFTSDKQARFLKYFPEAILGGTGTDSPATVENIVGDFHGLDYSAYPMFTSSIGFTQRGCRLNCSFCVVPKKEGKPSKAQTLNEIWRGPGFPKHIHLLDNDFFSIKDWWQERIAEARVDKFKISFTQGINVRVITDDVAAGIASIEYRDDSFSRRRLYTAWDNLGEERTFFRGIDRLERNGVPGRNIMAYMLVGFADGETIEEVQHRFERMKDREIKPYPMVYDCRSTDPERYKLLKRFQRWAITGIHRVAPFSAYDAGKRRDRSAA